ncbi:N-acetylmuramoyl-L-alanine amidase [Carnobacterium maltaromaticum]|uniref:N-acetylmuramoyl-L-alanine amidase n=1 Tax=Carnobacterium maltaromaticum TaxID=2751 RepID=A0AAW9JZ71_CARML|nr:N-acetylmuramoyl-L-alanine amidase [Carnobacterium maltaromaticum]MDZ5758801.1 N-acetylmuramoyl-L-alanine amidase [Carnobacterium maltaromaticum]
MKRLNTKKGVASALIFLIFSSVAPVFQNNVNAVGTSNNVDISKNSDSSISQNPMLDSSHLESQVTSSSDSNNSTVVDETVTDRAGSDSEASVEQEMPIKEEDANDTIQQQMNNRIFDELDTNPSKTEAENFILSIVEPIKELSSTNDLYASIMIAQAILESNYGKSDLAQPGINNLFGMKWKNIGEFHEKITTEQDQNGNEVLVSAKFKKFDSQYSGMVYYVDRLKKGPGFESGSTWNPYIGAWKSTTSNYLEAVNCISASYATDGKYAEKLNNLINQYNLTQYDNDSNESAKELPLVNFIDSPTWNGRLTNKTNVYGWALGSSKLKKVTATIDGVSMGEGIINISRPDVDRFYPQYQNLNSGFSLDMDTSAIPVGRHTLAVQMTMEDGSIQTDRRVVEKFNETPNIFNLDSPTWNGRLTNSTSVHGWALGTSKLKQVNISINNVFIGNASINVSRPDVNRIYPLYNNNSAGFEYKMDTSSISVGRHTLTVQMIMEDGSIQTDRRVVEKFPANPTIFNIDRPTWNDQLGVSKSVYGWLLSDSPLRKVEVYVNNILVGQPSINESRPDVGRTYPQYSNNNAGFSLEWDTSKLSVGRHTLKIVMTTADGRTYTDIRSVEKVSLPLAGKQISLDAGHGGSDPGAVYQQNSIYEKTLNLEVALKIKAKLEAQGAKVVMSRVNDTFVPLTQIATIANNARSDIFVSVHHNVFSNPSVKGIETYSYDGSGRSLADDFNPRYEDNLASRLIVPFAVNNNPTRITESSKLANNVQDSLIASTNAENRRAKKANFQVLRETNMPAILAELGFGTNPEELANLTTDAYQNKLAIGVTNGVKTYFNK